MSSSMFNGLFVKMISIKPAARGVAAKGTIADFKATAGRRADESIPSDRVTTSFGIGKEEART